MNQELVERAPESFRFYTRLHLQELTGIRAGNLNELIENLKTVPGSVIYHHTHHFLQQHQYLCPEPPNDFAYWVMESLNEVALGEKLASINTHEYATIRALREKIIGTIETHVAKSKNRPKEANEGDEFHFIKSISFVLPTAYEVWNLREFVAHLKNVGIHSIYFHMFEAKLRLEKGMNDFSLWFENSLKEKDLATRIERLDPYTHTMEGLRDKIIGLINSRLKQYETGQKKTGT